MPATLTIGCGACGERHELVLIYGNMPDANRRYEYVCPNSMSRVRLESSGIGWWKTVATKPAGSIVVSEVP